MSIAPSKQPSTPAGGVRALPGAVWATSWVSFFTDASTELIYAILPAFYQTVLNLNAFWQGLIEGAAEAIASITKLFSGTLSDRTGRRKWWMVAGYTLSTLSKPLLPFAGGAAGALALRGADRLGKGVRGAPRDALVSLVVDPRDRGRAFGVNRAMDHAGALAGALTASLLLYMQWVSQAQLFLWTLLPGTIAVLIIIFFVHEPRPADAPAAATPPKSRPLPLSPLALWRQRREPFARYLLVLALFSLGNSTDALLLLRARGQMIEGGVAEATAAALLPLLWAWLHVLKSSSAAWGGRLSDRIGRRLPVQVGWLVYAAVYAGFALWPGRIAPWVLFGIYGLYYGLVEGPTSALVADLTPGHERGRAFGLYHLIVGVSALPASLLCGGLWWWGGPMPAFLAGAALALLAAALLPWALAQSQQGAGSGGDG